MLFKGNLDGKLNLSGQQCRAWSDSGTSATPFYPKSATPLNGTRVISTFSVRIETAAIVFKYCVQETYIHLDPICNIIDIVLIITNQLLRYLMEDRLNCQINPFVRYLQKHTQNVDKYY